VTEQPTVPENEEQAAEEPPAASEPATVADTEITPAPADAEIAPAPADTDPASVTDPAPVAESQAPEPTRPPPPPLPQLPSDGAAGSPVRDRPEVTVAAAFAGGLLIALILRRLAR
jgi:hypothetical protein